MTPVWRALSTVLALIAGFTIPVVAASVFVGVKHHGIVAIVGVVALVVALSLVLLFARGRLRF